MRRFALGCVAVGLLAGCGERDDSFFDDAPQLTAPVAVGERFVVVDTSRQELYRLTPDGGSLDVTVEELDGRVVRRQGAPGGGLDLLLADPPAYVHVAPEGAVERVELPAGYDLIEARDDGRFVVFAYAPGSPGTGDQVLFNPNQISVFDREGDELRTFALNGSRPESYWFAPPLTLNDPGTPLHLLAIGTAGYVSLVDLTTEDAADRQRRIPLADPSTAATIRANRVVFGQESPADPFDATMYVTTPSVADLYAVDLLPADPATGRTLQPAINQIALGGVATSFTPFSMEGEEKFLALTPGGVREAYVVDPVAGTAEPVSLDVDMTQAIVWEQAIDGAVRPQALLYAEGRTIAFFVDLASFERQGMGAVRAVQLGGSVESVRTVGEGDALRALVRYGGGLGLEVVNLTSRTLVPIPSTVGLGEVVVSGDRVFAVAPGVERLLGVDLNTQSPFEIEMGRGGSTVHVSEDGTALLVAHPDAFGVYSLFETGSLADGPSGELNGLVWHDVFSRAEP